MKLNRWTMNRWTLWGFLAASALMVPILQAEGAIAQTAPESSQTLMAQSGAWVPVARVNPNQAVEIRLVNRAGLPIEYSLTTNEAPPRRIEPGNTGYLGEVPIPAYVLVNALTAQVSLEYDITVGENNVVTVSVSRINPDLPGVSTFNINQTGAIYVY